MPGSSLEPAATRAELPGRPERVFRHGDGRLLFSIRQVGPVHNEDLLGSSDGLVIDLHTDDPAGGDVDLGQDASRR